MPIPKSALNGFTARQVHSITGLSQPMIEYLRRMDYLQPSHSPGKPRKGVVRYYSYRDLVIARLIQRLRDTGVELARLKGALEFLRSDENWNPGDATEEVAGRLKWLVSDGKTVWLKSQDGFLDFLGPKRQRAFAFVVSINGIGEEVKEKLSTEQLSHFSMENRKLMYQDAPRRPQARDVPGKRATSKRPKATG